MIRTLLGIGIVAFLSFGSIQAYGVEEEDAIARVYSGDLSDYEGTLCETVDEIFDLFLAEEVFAIELLQDVEIGDIELPEGMNLIIGGNHTLTGSIAIGEDTTFVLIEGLELDGEIFTYVEGCDVAATETEVEIFGMPMNATAYTLSAALPKANVEPMAEEDMPTDPKLDAAFVFTPSDSEPNPMYGEWRADFEISFGGDVEEGAVWLYGQYDKNSDQWIGFPLPAVGKEGKLRLMAKFDANLTFNEVFNLVGEFRCGVINKSAETAGVPMTVKLILIDPADEDAQPIVIAEQPYTLEAPQGPASWDDVTEETSAAAVVPAEIKDEIAASQVTASEIKNWALNHKVDIAAGNISVNALIFNCAPTEAPKTDADAKNEADKVLAMVTKDVDLAALLKSAQNGVVEISSEAFPMAKIELKEVSGVKTSAKLFRLSIMLK